MCREFGPGERLVLSASVIKCDWSFLHWASLIPIVMFMIVCPLLVVISYLHGARTRFADVDFHAEYSVFLVGYGPSTRSWWEVLVFLSKSACISIPLRAAAKTANMAFLVMFLGVAGLIIVTDPFDTRADRILKAFAGELLLLSITKCLAFAMCNRMAAPSANSAFQDTSSSRSTSPPSIPDEARITILCVIGCMVFADLLYVFRLAKQLVKHTVAGFMLDFDRFDYDLRMQEGDVHCFFDAIASKLLKLHDRAMRKTPYACMDHTWGWITVCGSRGDLAAPTQIPCGRSSTLPKGRLDLSNAPDRPPKPRV